MIDFLTQTVKNFLQGRSLSGKPLLLGYSGGPDSKALLHALLECRRFFPVNLHVAHVDHGWRQESADEAEGLKGEVERLGLPWHGMRVSPGSFQEGNLENEGRMIRLRFFSELYHTLDCQALLLGHHGDDQAEVVMKRIFEGAHLFALGGLHAQTALEGMQIWRPLLGVRKKNAIQWLEERQLPYLCDPTNESSRFLRGRMRQELLPTLTQAFGKEVSLNLCHLGQQAQELKEYFSSLNAPLLNLARRDGDRVVLDLSPHLPLPSLQLKYLLKEWFSSAQRTPSRQILEGIVDSISSNGEPKRFCFQECTIVVHCGVVSIYIKNNS